MFWQANKTVKKKKKSNICGRNSSALRQVYSLVLAGWIPEINFPDPGSENNSLSFVRETRLGPIFISGDNLWPQNHMTLSAGDPGAARQSVWDAISLSLPDTFSPSLSPRLPHFLFPHLSCYLRDCMKVVRVWRVAETYVSLFKKATSSAESFIYLFFGPSPWRPNQTCNTLRIQFLFNFIIDI